MSTSTINTSIENSTAEAGRTARRDRAAKVILGLCAVGAGLATATAIGSVADTEGVARLAETWRLFGFPVFAGIFSILAAGPRRVAGLWELVIANKIALVIAGATFLSGIEGSRDFVYVDGVLVALLLTAYTLTRGWTAWTNQ